KLDEVYQSVRQKMTLNSEKIKRWYDQGARKCSFEEGQKVWVFNPQRKIGKAPKLQSNWEEPYEIVKRLNEVVYCIRKSSKSRNKVVHADRLASFSER
ncbi:hypothetical protein EAI_04701, partial [Harpegnathos saltator]